MTTTTGALELLLVRIESKADAIDIVGPAHRVGVQMGLDMAADLVRETLAMYDQTAQNGTEQALGATNAPSRVSPDVREGEGL